MSIALVLHGRGAAGGKEGASKFIATVREGHNALDVARQIEHHAMEKANRWEGSVERTHEAIGIVIVSGPQGSCQVLREVDGVSECEVDSVVTIA